MVSGSSHQIVLPTVCAGCVSVQSSATSLETSCFLVLRQQACHCKVRLSTTDSTGCLAHGSSCACIHILRDSRCTRRQEADTAACQMAVELWQYLSASCCGAAAGRGLAVLGGHGLLVVDLLLSALWPLRSLSSARLCLGPWQSGSPGCCVCQPAGTSPPTSFLYRWNGNPDGGCEVKPAQVCTDDCVLACRLSADAAASRRHCQ